MADNRNTLTDEILVLAETLGDIKSRFERVEAEFETQSKPLEAALSALSAAMTGIKTLQHHVLDNSLSALSLKVEEQRKAIDEQITVLVGELKGADQQNAEKIALQTAELKTQFAAISDSVRQLSSQFEAQIKRVELEAKQELTKFAAIPGPQGPAGASINPRGNWIDGVTYNRLDVVSLLGTSYISAVDGNTSKPTKGDKWTILARSGTGGGGAGNFGSLAGVAEITQGGTGQTTALAGARALLDGISTTRGTVIYRGSDGWAALAPGSADQVLKTQGAGADPAWGSTTNATAATNAQAAAGTSTTTFITPANAEYAAAPVVNPRAARQGLVFDGTDNALLSVPLGTSDATIALWLKTDFSVSTERYLTTSTNAQLYSASANNITLYTAGGNVVLGNAFSANKTHLVVLCFSGTTATPYVNGVAGTPATVSADRGTVTVLGGQYVFAKAFLSPFIYNRALSAAEVVALYESGVPAGADYNTASNTAINTSAFVNTNYTTFSGASATGFTAAASSGSKYAEARPTLTISKGQRFRFTGTLTLNNGKTVLPYVLVQTDSTAVQIPASGSFDVTVTADTTTSGAAAYFRSTGDADYTVSNVSITRLGLLLAPDSAQAGGGVTWYDTSGNAANITLPASGVTWNVPTSGKMASALNITNTTDSSSKDTGCLVLEGGLGVEKKATFGGGINGTTTNDSAAAGCVGEYVSATVAYASRAANTDGVLRNVTTISLTAGDWDVEGSVAFEGTSATVTILTSAVSVTSGTIDNDYEMNQLRTSITSTSNNIGVLPTGRRRISIGSTTTVYLLSRAFFSAGTVETYGSIRARRVR